MPLWEQGPTTLVLDNGRYRHVLAKTVGKVHRIEYGPDGSIRIPTLPTTREALLIHARKHGDESIYDVAAWDGLGLESLKPRRNEKRIAEVHRLFQEHKPVAEIVRETGLSRQTVKKYLAMPSEPMEESGAKTPSSASNSSNPTQTLPEAWNTPKKRSLGEKVTALAQSGLMAMAIADRLGKSDDVVRRYLREAEAVGLLATAA